MPIVSCVIDGQPGYKWGDSGKCYTFEPGNAESMKVARARAAAQAQAAYSAGYQEEDVKLPSYVISALKKGLELHKDGLSGDGLRPATVRAASDAVKSGTWSDDKIIRAAAWLARHASDKELTGGRDWSDPPTPGFVAWLLWGDSGNGKGRKWIQSMADKIKSKRENADDRDQATPAPPEDRIKGGKNTGRGTAKSASPKFNKQTEIALKRLVKKHNDQMGGDDRKIATLPMLKKVYLRGLGAFSTNHRPGVTRSQWGFGRVNAFLKMLKNLKPDDPKYNGPDNDLLPKSHPLSSKKEEVEMKNYEGGYYKYEGRGDLYEANWGMKFVALRHTLGDMLHYYMAKEITDDDVAAKYIEDMGKMIDAAKQMPEHGEAAKTSFYSLMSMVADVLQNWQERSMETAGGMMYHSLKMIQDKFEGKSYSHRDDRDQKHAGYDKEDEMRYEEATVITKDILSYIAKGETNVEARARLERKADSIVLIAENAGHENHEEVAMLRAALRELRK
jgi:hypothetical protein